MPPANPSALRHLTPQSFVRLCLELILSEGFTNVAYVGGNPGDSFGGIDILGRRGGKRWAFVASHRRSNTPKFLRQVAEKVLRLRADDHPEFLVLMTSTPIPTRTREAFRQAIGNMTNSIGSEVWSGPELEVKLSRYPAVGDLMFNIPEAVRSPQILLQLSPERFQGFCAILGRKEGFGRLVPSEPEGLDFRTKVGGRQIGFCCLQAVGFSRQEAHGAAERLLAIPTNLRPQEVVLIATCNLGFRARTVIQRSLEGKMRLSIWAGEELNARACRHPDVLELLRTAYLHSLNDLTSLPIEFYSCFIAYSHADREFAHKLYARIDAEGINCWLDEHRILPGDDLFQVIDDGIRLWDKILVCCSESSLGFSSWVDIEVEKALQKEAELQRQHGRRIRVLIPINLDGYLFSKHWKSGKASVLRGRLAADFTGWADDSGKFEEQLERVLRALRADEEARDGPPESKL